MAEGWGSVTRIEDGGSILKSDWVDTVGSSGPSVSHWECTAIGKVYLQILRFAQRVVSAENRFLNTRLLILCDSCGVATSRRLSAVLVDDRPGGIREYDNRTDRKWQPIVVR